MSNDDIKFRPFRGKINIPDNLVKYRVFGKGILPFTIAFHTSKLNEKVAEWHAEGLSFQEVKQ